MSQPTPPERQPAYDAVYAVIRQYPVTGLAGAMENARVWRAVEAALDAMQAAGRLLPAETETRTEWATRLKAHGEYAEELSESFGNSVMTEEERARHRAEIWRRRFAAELVDVMRREVHTTPWSVAEPAAEVKP
ncbi:hypothetical protein [Micromonospora sp. NPDC005113]